MSFIILIEEIYEKVNSSKFKEKIKKELCLDEVTEIEVKSLGNGEYNYNFLLCFNEQKAVLRMNFGSQIGLGDDQIEYEYKIMRFIEESNYIPHAIFEDSSFEIFERPYLVMEYVKGRHLNYDIEKDLEKAADSLCNIHKYSKEKLKELDSEEFNCIICPKSPMKALIEECETMYSEYEESAFFDEEVDAKIQEVFAKCRIISKEKEEEIDPCIINTELNSTNFLVSDEKCTVIDWEKPVIGELEQDLGHFLAPTTTFWKSEVILVPSQIDRFLENYIDSLERLGEDIEDKMVEMYKIKKKTYKYIILNCLRGLTWCSMAWVQYNNNLKEICNEDTYEKLKQYLGMEFIDMVLRDFVYQM